MTIFKKGSLYVNLLLLIYLLLQSLKNFNDCSYNFECEIYWSVLHYSQFNVIYTNAYRQGVLWLINLLDNACTYVRNRDDYDFPIVRFPFMSSNIPAEPAWGVQFS